MKMSINGKEKCRVRLKILLHALFTLTVVLQVWISDGGKRRGIGIGDEDGDSVTRYACNGFATLVLLQFTAHLDLCSRIPVDIVRYINGHLQCIGLLKRKRLMFWERTLIEKLNILFARILYWTAIVTPFLFILGIHWTFPCRASLVAYWILDQCKNPNENLITTNSHLSLISLLAHQLKKGLVFLINLYFWAFGVRVTCFVVGGIQILCQMTMRDYLTGFWDKCKYEDERGGNGKGMRRELQMYRLIQVMGNLNNDIQQKTMMSCLMSTGVVIHSISLFTLVRLPWNTGSNLIPLSIYTLMLANCSLAIIVCFGGMLNIHTDSEQVLRNLKSLFSHTLLQVGIKRNRMEVKWRRKFLTSCSPIKVKFGLTNFLERRTPLNSMDVSIGLTVQLLLLIN